MSPIRYRRTSVRTALGITKEEKRIKRELGITAILKPFRWWGNEKRKIKREVGYYSPEAKFARHFLPRSVIRLFLLVVALATITFAIWVWNSMKAPATPDNTAATVHEAGALR
ncbi:MAG TPA: hypothetical protein VMJ32_10800 [Pirellulales bacterium]|nr:hypothetical protein [Pirellulales bacterium]